MLESKRKEDGEKREKMKKKKKKKKKKMRGGGHYSLTSTIHVSKPQYIVFTSVSPKRIHT